MKARGLRSVVATTAAILMLVGACRGGGQPGPAPTTSAATAPSQAPPLDTSWERVASHVLAKGDTAPDFEGIAHTGMRVRLSAFRERPLVVCFYDADGSDLSRSLVEEIRDQWLTLLPKISMVIGVSADDRIRHTDFATEERLPFLLVADEKRAIAQAFGVAPGTAVTFVVGTDGKVLGTFTNSPAGKRTAEIVAAIP